VRRPPCGESWRRGGGGKRVKWMDGEGFREVVGGKLAVCADGGD
jgi:hypothetical protein